LQERLRALQSHSAHAESVAGVKGDGREWKRSAKRSCVLCTDHPCTPPFSL
jgi:hypothetical protein